MSVQGLVDGVDEALSTLRCSADGRRRPPRTRRQEAASRPSGPRPSGRPDPEIAVLEGAWRTSVTADRAPARRTPSPPTGGEALHSCQVAARYPKGSALDPAWATPRTHSDEHVTDRSRLPVRFIRVAKSVASSFGRLPAAVRPSQPGVAVALRRLLAFAPTYAPARGGRERSDEPIAQWERRPRSRSARCPRWSTRPASLRWRGRSRPGSPWRRCSWPVPCSRRRARPWPGCGGRGGCPGQSAGSSRACCPATSGLPTVPSWLATVAVVGGLHGVYLSLLRGVGRVAGAAASGESAPAGRRMARLRVRPGTRQPRDPVGARGVLPGALRPVDPDRRPRGALRHRDADRRGQRVRGRVVGARAARAPAVERRGGDRRRPAGRVALRATGVSGSASPTAQPCASPSYRAARRPSTRRSAPPGWPATRR